MNFADTKTKVKNRGVPPDAFLCELVSWGRVAAVEIFSRNNNPNDIYSSIAHVLGPWQSDLHRRAVMLEVMRVTAGFESSWDWECGVDITNPTSNTPDTIETGIFQVSANSRNFGQDLRDISPSDGDEFQRVMKVDHNLAMEYFARLLRHTCSHNGPVKRHEIDPWLSPESVDEFVLLLV